MVLEIVDSSGIRIGILKENSSVIIQRCTNIDISSTEKMQDVAQISRQMWHPGPHQVEESVPNTFTKEQELPTLSRGPGDYDKSDPVWGTVVKNTESPLKDHRITGIRTTKVKKQKKKRRHSKK